MAEENQDLEQSKKEKCFFITSIGSDGSEERRSMRNESRKFYGFVIPMSILGFILHSTVFTTYFHPYENIVWFAYMAFVGFILFNFILKKSPWEKWEIQCIQ